MKIYDLSLPFSKDMPVFPGTPGMDYALSHTVEKDNYNLGIASINSHAGTHTDAPRHFLAKGSCLNDVDINHYIGYAVVIDCTGKAAFDAITIDDAKPYEDVIKKHKKVIFRTDWSKLADQECFYTDYPIVTESLADYLVGLGIHMIGVESPSLNPEKYIEVHKTFLANDVAVVEALTNLDLLPQDVIFFSGAPVGMAEADGFPIRAVAIIF